MACTRVLSRTSTNCSVQRLGLFFTAQNVSGTRAFSTDNSYTGQLVRIERLWREFYLGSSHWRTKDGPEEPMWIEDAGTNATKKAKKYPLPGTQFLTNNPTNTPPKVSTYY